VLFLDSLIKGIRKKGWTIISAKEAIRDPMYSLEPKNTNSSFGLLSQMAHEKNGKFVPYYDFERLKKRLNAILGI
jgi:hypothetical protein